MTDDADMHTLLRGRTAELNAALQRLSMVEAEVEQLRRILVTYMEQVSTAEGVFFTRGSDWSAEDWPIVRAALVEVGHYNISVEDDRHNRRRPEND